MKTVAVIIPYFQREPGILSRALDAVCAQQLPEGWAIEVIVIDDGSPHPAREEVQLIASRDQVHLRIIEQPNAGAPAARNRGLEELPTHVDVVAFLDSDDLWPTTHIATAIDAYNLGYDFCFSDNRRPGYHESVINEPCPGTRALCPGTRAFLQNQESDNGIKNLPVEEFVSLIIQECPTQTSTVTFRRSLYPELRFNIDLDKCGEDMLFFVALASKARRIGFIEPTQVECGKGVNIYFGNLAWDNPSYLGIKHDQVRSHTLINQLPNLTRRVRAVNNKVLFKHRRNFVFHTVRHFIKTKGRVPIQLRFMIRADPSFLIWFPLCFLRMLVEYPIGRYKP